MTEPLDTARIHEHTRSLTVSAGVAMGVKQPLPPVITVGMLCDEIDRLRAENERLRAVAEAAKEYVRQALPAPHDLRLRDALARVEHSDVLEEDPALDYDRDDETRGAQLSQGGDR